MIDLYTALKLCSNEDYFILNGIGYSRKEIIQKLDMRKIKVKKIYFDMWHDTMAFKTQG